MATKTKVPVIGSIVKYFDMANQNSAPMKVIGLPEGNQKTPSGYPLPPTGYKLIALDGAKDGQIGGSDLRQSGWSILDEESQTWLQVNWEG